MKAEMHRAGLVFRLNDKTIVELNAIEAEAVELAARLESLSPQDFQRVQAIFDAFYPLLDRVRSNLILVEVEACPEVDSGPRAVVH